MSMGRFGMEMDGVPVVLAALRRRGHEAQLTQVLAAFARADPWFARELVAALLARAPERERVEALGELPAKLECRAEMPVKGIGGQDLGRVDLSFKDPGWSFRLLVELKLFSAYGDEQLDRYLEALDALPAPNARLLAVTTHPPLSGEAAVASDPRWLGSVRWAQVFERLRTCLRSGAGFGCGVVEVPGYVNQGAVPIRSD